MTKVDRLKQAIVELDNLTITIEDLVNRTKFAELKLTDFSFHMTEALNGVDDACDEVKKIVEQMEESHGD